MTYQEVLVQAREAMAKCKACPVCNGKACGNNIPGPGSKGIGDTAMRNYSKWLDIRVNMDTISDVAASRSLTSAPWGFTSMRFMPGRTKKL